jgi:hypothetical protein
VSKITVQRETQSQIQNVATGIMKKKIQEVICVVTEVKKKTTKCSKRNPEPNPKCGDGYYEKENTKGNMCCYKSKKKKKLIKSNH